MAVLRIGAGIAYEVALMLMERQIAQMFITEVGTVILHLSSLWVGSRGNALAQVLQSGNYEHMDECKCRNNITSDSNACTPSVSAVGQSGS